MMREPLYYSYLIVARSSRPDFPGDAAKILRRIAAERNDEHDKSTLLQLVHGIENAVRTPQWDEAAL